MENYERNIYDEIKKEPPEITKELVKEYIEKFEEAKVNNKDNGMKKEELKKYKVQEEIIKKFFEPGILDEIFKDDLDAELKKILVKVNLLNGFYSTNIYATYDVAENIKEQNICFDVEKGIEYENVSKIANIKISGKDKNFYSFATKYCNHHDKRYPIIDSFVKQTLIYFNNRKNKIFFEVQSDLDNYESFVNILHKFINVYEKECIYEEKPLDFKRIDEFLWLYGKEHFSKYIFKASKKGEKDKYILISEDDNKIELISDKKKATKVIGMAKARKVQENLKQKFFDYDIEMKLMQ